MKVPHVLLALLAAVPPLGAQSAPRVTTTLSAGELKTLETVRRDVWIHWFAGDTAALRRVLTPELVAISPDSKLWQGLEQTLEGSARFKAGGGSLAALEFSNTTVHAFGDVAVMFSRYAMHLLRNGQHSEQTGRATEVFVRRSGKWVHTSWHLDVAP